MHSRPSLSEPQSAIGWGRKTSAFHHESRAGTDPTRLTLHFLLPPFSLSPPLLSLIATPLSQVRRPTATTSLMSRMRCWLFRRRPTPQQQQPQPQPQCCRRA